MTDYPEAVREYEELSAEAVYNRVHPLSLKDKADAAIAALKEMVETPFAASLIEKLAESESDLLDLRGALEAMTVKRDRAEARAVASAGKYDKTLRSYEKQILEADAEVERLKWMLDEAWTERRKIRSERKYGINLRTKKMWLADLDARWENR